jgi:uncharacterized protein YfiM (DUF2279 family)
MLNPLFGMKMGIGPGITTEWFTETTVQHFVRTGMRYGTGTESFIVRVVQQ